MRLLLLLSLFALPAQAFSPACEKILEGIEVYAPVAEAYAEATRRFPDSTFDRAAFLVRHLGRTANPLRFTRSEWRHRDAPYYREKRFFYPARPQVLVHNRPSTSLRAIPFHNTTLYAHALDTEGFHPLVTKTLDPALHVPRFQPRTNARGIFAWTHGLTAVISQGERVFEQLRRMNTQKTHDGVSQHINRQGLWRPLTTVGFDQPFHGTASCDPELCSLERSMERQDEIFQALAHYRLPLAAGCRSGSNLALAQLNYEYELQGRNPLRAMVWMSPMHPVIGFEETLEGYYQANVLKSVTINPLAFDWFISLNHQLIENDNAWWKSDRPVGKTPLLILVGELDLEVPLITRKYYQALAARFPDQMEYVEIPGAGHDLFALSESSTGERRVVTASAQRRAAAAWERLYRFLDRHGL